MITSDIELSNTRAWYINVKRPFSVGVSYMRSIFIRRSQEGVAWPLVTFHETEDLTVALDWSPRFDTGVRTIHLLRRDVLKFGLCSFKQRLSYGQEGWPRGGAWRSMELKRKDPEEDGGDFPDEDPWYPGTWERKPTSTHRLGRRMSSGTADHEGRVHCTEGVGRLWTPLVRRDLQPRSRRSVAVAEAYTITGLGNQC
ncbi:hypothetical protein NDU88_004760 [Pleurodeles waltl]|uniref:Uncharacterized protein n=1 Tax=Pleurodeles waltl TaxID=8319 RepID=A0AAV7TTD2_PLEWA|nr:hypothetical protein NDU88_004760 [Pleurodeles waltl]